ncbi:sensor histidine kinase [Geodermatophilus sp. SYSU D00815]
MPPQQATSGGPAAGPGPGPPWRRLASGGLRDGARAERRPPSVRRVLGRFVAANLVVAALLLAGSAWAGHRAACAEAFADARETTDLLAELFIEPNLDGLLTRDRDAMTALDTVAAGPLREADVVRIKIWDADSRVVYSDARRLIGHSYPLSEEKLALLRSGGTLAEISSLREEENVFETPQEERLLEVYRGVTTPDGDQLLLEAYFDTGPILDRRVSIWLTFAPITAAVLLAMLLAQLPLARRLVRQVREGDAERLRLHARAADASVEERRRIAGSLHDGVVQDLAASPLHMSRAVDLLRRQPADAAAHREVADGLQQATLAVRASVASLRSLLIEIYPPHLAQAGLPAALADLVARVEVRGVRARLDLPDDDVPVPPEVEGLLFRTAQEALLNTATHARAETVTVSLHRNVGSVTLEVRDDGAGFDPDDVTAGPESGHFGLRVLADLAEAAGATLHLATAPGRGTALRLQVPVG